jgi:hypothetical protein
MDADAGGSRVTGWIPRPVGGFIYRPDQRRTIKDRNGNKISIDGHDDQTLIIRTDSDSGAHSCTHTMPFDMEAAERLARELHARIQAAHDWADADKREGK